MSMQATPVDDYVNVVLEFAGSGLKICECQIQQRCFCAHNASLLQGEVRHAIVHQLDISASIRDEYLRLDWCMVRLWLHHDGPEITQDPTSIEDFPQEKRQFLKHLAHLARTKQDTTANNQVGASIDTNVVLAVGMYPPHCKLVRVIKYSGHIKNKDSVQLQDAFQNAFQNAFASYQNSVQGVVLDETVMTNPGILAALCQKFPHFATNIPVDLLSNKQFMLKVPAIQHMASTMLLEDMDFVMRVFSSRRDEHNESVFQKLSQEMRNTKQIVVKAMWSEGWQVLKHASEVCKGDIQIVRYALSFDQFALALASEELRQNEELICMCLATLPAAKIAAFRKDVLLPSWIKKQKLILKNSTGAL
jgi:hypothetical protein